MKTLETFKTFREIFEGTVASDIAQAVPGNKKSKCPCEENPDSEECKAHKRHKSFIRK